ncbi:MAG: SH3 domain-containing protein, partial [Lachnospiraceae bacterium]|nr:SH3 domain-containing protein [Lachnospiraceae bacterium]
GLLKKYVAALLLGVTVLTASLSTDIDVLAKGPTYSAKEDVYYTKANCIVYAEPTYTSLVITTLDANLPVRVIGEYSNGWYRINIGVIGYVKWDSVTTAGAIGLPNKASAQVADAQRIAAEIGYEFVYLTLNDEKTIKKDIYNSYVGQKVMLYAKLDDEIGVSFKMLYEDKVKSDINLKFTKTATTGMLGDRILELVFDEDKELLGQIAIFQFREGYDKAITINTVDLSSYDYVEMNTYYTEFSEFAYAPVTQIANMKIIDEEIPNSLTDKQRARMTDLQRGIKYQSYDNKEYRSSIHSRLRKDTEYVDYDY